MSTSILYLAIVGIWAGFLVPGWLRRPHGVQLDGADVDDGFVAEEGGFAGDDGLVADDAFAGDDMPVAEDGFAGDDVSVADDGFAADEADVESDADGGAADRGAADVHREVGRDYRPAGRSGPPQSRAQMLAARRRVLGILVALTVAAVASVFSGLAPWWIGIPPAGMLGLYVLLLREVAMAETERARRGTAVSAAARTRVARGRVGVEPSAYADEPIAQVIDISDRVGDELYDQYADAAVRAVGD